MIKNIISICERASEEILKIYDNDSISFETKSDDSPVTQADLVSNRIIIEGLNSISEFPVLTEESSIEYNIRKDWNKYWLVDPLDGTKDFIAKTGGFTINIALIENNRPVLGVVYVPVNNDVYYAEAGCRSYKNGKIIHNNSKRKELIAATSVFHTTELMESFFIKNNIKDVRKYGSSIKICKLAEGIIDVYPRLNGTKEWDTAASHIIANEAGCKLIDVETKNELVYNKISLKNNHFIASRNDLNFN